MGKKAMVLVAGSAALLMVLAGCSGSSGSDPQAGAAGTGRAVSAQPAAQSGGTGQAGAGAGQAGSGTARAGAFTGQGSGGAGGRRAIVVSVQAITVPSGPLVTDNDTAGSVVAATQSSVATQVAGVVQRVLHKSGDWVKLGEPIIQLDDSSLKLSVQNAQAALDNANINLSVGQQSTSESGPRLQEQLQSAQTSLEAAQKNYDSQKASYDLGGISASTLDNAKSALDTAQANVAAAQLALDQNTAADTQTVAQLKIAVRQAETQLAMAQLNLQNAAIRAPFAGQIAAANVTPGMYVSVNTAAFILVSTDRQVNFTMPPADAPSFKVGDVVQFHVSGKGYPVRITQAPSAPINGVVPMVGVLPSGVTLPYGTVGTVTYKLTIGNGPQIPIAALQSQANVNFVYTIVNGKAVQVPVTIVAETGATAVVQGVNAGDQVVVNPPPGLLPGSTVQAVAVAAGGQQGQQGAQGQQATRSSSTGSGSARTGTQSGQRTGGATSGSGGAGSGSTAGQSTGVLP